MGFINVWMNHQHQIDDARASTAELAGFVTAGVTQYMAAPIDLTKQVVDSLDLQDPGICSDFRFAQTLEPRIVNFVLQRVDGSYGCSARGEMRSVGWSLQRPWVKDAIASGEPQWSPPFIGRISGRWVVVLVTPLHDARGEVWGTLETAIGLQGVQRQVDQTAPQGVLITVTSYDGTVIARSESPEQWIGRRLPNASPSIVPTGPQTEYRTVDGADGISRLFGYRSVRGVPWTVYAGVPEDVMFASARKILALDVFLGLLALFLVFGFGRRLERGIVSSLSALGEQLKAVSFAGGLVKTPESAPAEVVDFVDQYNSLLKERSIALEEAATKRELERSNELKGQFLAVVSHELRTPLNTVLGMAEALDEGAFGVLTEEQRSSIELIGESGRGLLGLIDDILDFTELESEDPELNPEWVDIPELCDSLVSEIAPTAAGKRIAFMFQNQAESSIIRVDKRLVRKALTHVVDNAVKFTPEGGSVGLTVGENAGEIYFDCRDTGVGIPDANLGEIFEPFAQLDQTLSRGHTGIGLGLMITKRVVELHGGKVNVNSRPRGGTSVRITFPLNGAAVAI